MTRLDSQPHGRRHRHPLTGQPTLLDLRIASDKFIEGLGVGLRAIHGKCEVVVLEIESHAGEVDFAFDSHLLQLLGIAFKARTLAAVLSHSRQPAGSHTNTRALKDQRRGQRATRDYNLLASLEDPRLEVIRVVRFGRTGKLG